MKIIDTELLDRTTREAKESVRLRMNHNFHERLDDPVHRLLNAVEPDTYLPVHRHLNPAKDEAILVLRGRAAAFVFDDEGRIVECAVIDPAAGVYGFDIRSGVWHGLLSLESGTVVYEVKAGPYAPVPQADIAPWTPDAGDGEAVARFMERLRNEIAIENSK